MTRARKSRPGGITRDEDRISESSLAQRELATLSDQGLMAGLKAGEMEPLGELYGRYRTTVKTALLRTAPSLNQGELEDLSQEVFITLQNTAWRYEEQVQLKAWIYGIALHKARSWHRKHQVRKRLLGERRGEPLGLAWPRSSSPAQTTELRELVDQALAQLPQSQKEVLLLHAIEGFSGEEISQMLGIKPNSVWSRLHRARQALLDAAEGNR